MKRFVAVLMLAGGLLVAGEVWASTISLSQGSGSINVSTDSTNSPDLTQSTRKVNYSFNSATNKLTFVLPDGASFYVTNVSESAFGQTSTQNVLGVPSSADSGYSVTINAILGIGSLAEFSIYDAASNTLLLNVTPDYSFIFGTTGSPAVVFEYISGNLTVKYPSTSSTYQINTTGEFNGSPSLSTYATYSLTVPAPTPSPSAVPTLSEWAQLMLGLMVISMLGWQWRKQQN